MPNSHTESSKKQEIAKKLALENYQKNLSELEQELARQPRNDKDKNLLAKGQDVLTQVQTIAADKPQELDEKSLNDLNLVLVCVRQSVISQNLDKTKERVRELTALAQQVAGHASPGWQKLSFAILVFACVALIAVGLLAAIPSGGSSLLLSVLGATSLGATTLGSIGTGVVAATAVTGSALAVHHREKGLAKSVNRFKEVLNENKKKDDPKEEKPTERRSEAYRAIVWRTEGMAKMIRSNFFLDKDKRPDSDKWDFLMNQILNPSKNRPKREAEKEGNIKVAMNPLTGLPADPSHMREDYDTTKNHDWTVLTSVTILPKDGNIELFGGHGIGILMDVRFCNLNDQKFIFNKEAMTFNDWWLRDDVRSQQLQQQYQGKTIDQVRKEERLAEPSSATRAYSEQLISLNARSITGIILHPNPLSKPRNQAYYEERFAAIDRKNYTSYLLGQVLPIIILGPKVGVEEYSIEEQNNDITAYLAEHPDSPKKEVLEKMLAFNKKYSKVEEVITGLGDVAKPAADISRITELQPLIEKKLELLNQRNDCYGRIRAMAYENDLYKVSDEDSRQSLRELSERIVDCDHLIAAIDTRLQEKFSNDPAALIRAKSDCRGALRKYELLKAALQPDVMAIINRLDAGRATEKDMYELNCIDMDHLLKDKALDKVAELKIQYIKNQILSQKYPGNVTATFADKSVKVTQSQATLLGLITKATESKQAGRWQVCLEKVLETVAQSLEKNTNPPLGLSFFEKPQSKELHSFYTFIADTLSIKPKGILESVEIPSMTISNP